MIDTIINFRDFGGLPSQFGGTVRRDRLYRSGSPAAVHMRELDRLLDLDFALIADLRHRGERVDEPSPWPATLARRVLAHDGGADVQAPHIEPLRQGRLCLADIDPLYEQFYRDLPFNPHYQPLLSRILTHMPTCDGRVLVHCSAGKDRTGMVVALILHALGVCRDAIVADYMLSRHAPGLLEKAAPAAERLSKASGTHVSAGLIRALLDVQPTYLAAFFDEIEHRCGTVDAYLDSAGLDQARRAALRRQLLVG